MTDAGEDGYDPEDPVVPGEEWYRLILAQDDGDVDGDEPEVTAEAVEYASEARVLMGEACELSVGAVKGVCRY